jgi:hypothetical protein
VGVSTRNLGERIKSLVFMCASSSAIFRLTVVTGIPSLHPAAERLPASTMVTNTDIAPRRSMIVSKNGKVCANNNL